MEREQRHPAVFWGGALCALGAAAGALSVLQVAEGHAALGAAGLSAGAVAAGLGGYLVVIGRANPVLTRAARAFTQGSTDEVLALTARVEAMPGRLLTRRSTELLRGMTALARGELEPAITHARASRSAGLGLLSRESKRMMATQASSYLALALALRGDPAAVAEALSVEQSPSALADAVARSILARAVLLDREGKRAELTALLRAEASLLLEAGWPRERALVRALRRRLRGRPAGGYRQEAPGGRPPEGEAPEIDAWLRKVAPGVLDGEGDDAPEEREAGAASPIEDESPDAARQRSRPAAVTSAPAVETPRSSRRILALVLAILAAWVFVGTLSVVTYKPAPVAHGPAPQGVDILEVLNFVFFSLPVVALVACVVALVSVARDTTRLGRALTAGQRLLWRGKPEEALAALAGPSGGRLPVAAAQAHMLAARALEHLGRPDEALARCEQGIALASKPHLRMATHDVIAPELRAERAFLLAALDREGEALSALEALEREFPAHAGREQARFRVSLVSSLRQGKLGEAARLAAARPSSMSVGLREELVCELLSLLPRGASAEASLARLREEVAETPGVEVWLDTYVPAALRALGRAGRGQADAARSSAGEITES